MNRLLLILIFPLEMLLYALCGCVMLVAFVILRILALGKKA